jgi:hypothetical protein
LIVINSLNLAYLGTNRNFISNIHGIKLHKASKCKKSEEK